jgi:DNA-binding LacI/PurR family transcriptional regulator
VEHQGIQEVDVFMAMAERPEAIIAVHDLVAINVIRRSSERGMKIPDAWAVAGFDDLYEAKIANPPLTTMRQSLNMMGRRAMEILIGEIRGEIVQPVIERLPLELVVRETT